MPVVRLIPYSGSNDLGERFPFKITQRNNYETSRKPEHDKSNPQAGLDYFTLKIPDVFFEITVSYKKNQNGSYQYLKKNTANTVKRIEKRGDSRSPSLK